MNENELQHSARGTHWQKKDHKYIRKEGNRYIYDEETLKNDVKKTATRTAFNKAGNIVVNNLPQPYRNVYNAANTAKTVYDVTKYAATEADKKKKRDALNKKLDTIERLNQMELEKKQAAERKVVDASRAKRKEQQNKELLRARNEKHQQELLERANNNRMNSGVRGGRTARDILSEKKTHRVMYDTTMRDKNGSKLTIRRTISTKPTYDDRGFKTSDSSYKDEIIKKTSDHPGGTARDMISRKGTRRVEYKNDEGTGKRYRVVTDKNYNKIRTEVEKWMGHPDRRNIFQKSFSKLKSKINIGKQFMFGTASDKKNKIPLNMRLKRDLKKLRKNN